MATYDLAKRTSGRHRRLPVQRGTGERVAHRGGDRRAVLVDLGVRRLDQLRARVVEALDGAGRAQIPCTPA